MGLTFLGLRRICLFRRVSYNRRGDQSRKANPSKSPGQAVKMPISSCSTASPLRPISPDCFEPSGKNRAIRERLGPRRKDANQIHPSAGPWQLQVLVQYPDSVARSLTWDLIPPSKNERDFSREKSSPGKEKAVVCAGSGVADPFVWRFCLRMVPQGLVAWLTLALIHLELLLVQSN